MPPPFSRAPTTFLHALSTMPLPIEVKATGAVTGRDLTGLRRIAEEASWRRRVVVCAEAAARVVDGIEIVPVREFLHRLWNGTII